MDRNGTHSVVRSRPAAGRSKNTHLDGIDSGKSASLLTKVVSVATPLSAERSLAEAHRERWLRIDAALDRELRDVVTNAGLVAGE